MGSLLRDSFGKEVGKRTWCGTFAGPLGRWAAGPKAVEVRRPELHFFPTKCCFFLCFSLVLFLVLFRRSRAQKKTQKKSKIHTTKKTAIHTTKKKYKSYHPKNTTPQKNKVIFLFVSASVSAFFLFFFCFFSAFGKLLLLKHFQLASPAQFQPPLSQPAPQASSPPTPQRPPAPRLSPQALPRPSPAAPAFYMYCTHSLLFCSWRCDGQHPKP